MPTINAFDPLDYGGPTNSGMQNAVAAARTALGAVTLSPGVTYGVTDPILLNWQQASIGCAVPGVKAKIVSDSPVNDVIQMADYMNMLNIRDLWLDRSVPTTNGAGIRGLGGTSHATLCNIRSDHHTFGFAPGGCDFGWLSDLSAIGNRLHGFYARTIKSFLPLQWVWGGNSIFASNGGSGVLYDIKSGPGTPGAPASISTGRISGVNTFANTGNGMAFIGDANNRMQAIRADNCFIGADGQDEVYVDCYGGDHRFDNIFTEQGGNRGFVLTANNPGGSVLRGITANGHKGHGILISSDETILTDSRAIGNNPWGVFVTGVRSQIANMRTRGDGPQTYGIVYGNNVGHHLVNHDGTANNLSSVSGTPSYAAANV